MLTLPAQGFGDVTPEVATEVISGAHYQWLKVGFGGVGAFQLIDANHPLPVELSATFAEDSGAVDGDKGIAVLGVRNDALAVKTSTDGDYGMLTIDDRGRLVLRPSGAPGAVAPDRALQVAGKDGSGNLQALKVNTDGSQVVDSELPAAVLLADAMGLPTAPETLSANQLSNGTTLDIQRGNVEGTALASAARTATTTSPNITAHNARGVIVFLNVTVGSGTGGLQVQIQSVDPVSGAVGQLLVLPTAQIAAGQFIYEMFPGSNTTSSGTSTKNIAGGTITRTFNIKVVHGDASSYTYSVGYCLLV